MHMLVFEPKKQLLEVIWAQGLYITEKKSFPGWSIPIGGKNSFYFNCGFHSHTVGSNKEAEAKIEAQKKKQL